MLLADSARRVKTRYSTHPEPKEITQMSRPRTDDSKLQVSVDVFASNRVLWTRMESCCKLVRGALMLDLLNQFGDAYIRENTDTTKVESALSSIDSFDAEVQVDLLADVEKRLKAARTAVAAAAKKGKG